MDYVFVTGVGVAKDKGDSLWLMRQKRAVKRSGAERPLVSKAEAEALLAELTSPLPKDSVRPSSSEAAKLVGGSSDARQFVVMLRRLYGKNPREDSDVEPRLSLEGFLVDELALVLNVDKWALPAFTTGLEKHKPKRGGARLEALHKAGIAGDAYDCEAPAIKLARDADLYGVWRTAVGALEPLKMYAVITDAEARGLNDPDRTVKGHLEVKLPGRSERWNTQLNHTSTPMLAVIPVRVPYLAAQYLRCGGVNASPEPEAHAAQQRAWFEAYGALPVAVEDLSMDLVVPRPPKGKQVAQVMKEQLAYCDELEVMPKKKREEFAAEGYWAFWWD